MTVRLKNTSERTLEGPFVLRAVTLDSQVADIAALNTKNGKTGPGAVWDLTSAVDGPTLAPGAVSHPIALTFKLRNVRSLSEPHVDRFGGTLVQLYARVLGHAS